MAQEEKGLVLRGFLLFAFIAAIVAVVLTILFWRAPASPATSNTDAEQIIPWVALPSAGAFPSGVSWYAISQLGETLPSSSGWEVRYYAAVALARRGSNDVPWPILREMLDENLQKRNVRSRGADVKEVVDENGARANVRTALRAIALWHEKQSSKSKKDIPADLRDVHKTVDLLAGGPVGELKSEAEKTRDTFFR